MTTIYLIRHSKKEKNYEIIENNDSRQLTNEKFILSVEGEKLASDFASLDELNNIDEVWASNYVRAIDTAKYIAYKNNLKINISNCFDERHYGTFDENIDKEKFWIEQFNDCNLKNKDGESQIDVKNRFDKKINELLLSNNKKIAIVCHNASILFYILKYCNLDKAETPKKITISYKNKILIDNSIMNSPSMFKLEFDGLDLVNIDYITMGV